MTHLVAPSGKEDFLPHTVRVQMMHEAFSVEMSELHGQGFEGVPFRYVMFNGLLKLFISECNTAHSLQFVVSEG